MYYAQIGRPLIWAVYQWYNKIYLMNRSYHVFTAHASYVGCMTSYV